MKKVIYLLTITLLAGTSFTQAQALKALFSYKTFYAPQNGPYIETYLAVNANSVIYKKNESGKFQGSIEIAVKYSDKDKVFHTDKYNLLSPEVEDTNHINFNFLDQQRVQLPNGTYKLEMVIRDRNADGKPYNLNQNISLEFYDHIISFSDIELVDKYTKNESPGILTKSGYDLIPYVDNFYGPAINSFKFYAEIYNTDKVLGANQYLISYYIQSYESKRVVETMRGFSKQNPEKVGVLIREIPIKDLPSGNYILVLEARNQQNELLATKEVFFQRSNAPILSDQADFQQRDITNTFASYITSKDSLSEYILSLRPISSSLEITFEANQLNLADLKIMQQFFYDFWVKRSPINPEAAWMKYYAEVLRVNNDFGTKILKGHETERGRVYLQYGPPNTITKSYTETSAYPYEIWHYYKIGNQTNRKFVFYNRDLVTNDFSLLHSDAQGEVYDSQWEMKLHGRDTQTRDFDETTKGSDYFGNKANENFTNPK
jgi:GWxTD domain-containing protein